MIYHESPCGTYVTMVYDGYGHVLKARMPDGTVVPNPPPMARGEFLRFWLTRILAHVPADQAALVESFGARLCDEFELGPPHAEARTQIYDELHVLSKGLPDDIRLVLGDFVEHVVNPNRMRQ